MLVSCPSFPLARCGTSTYFRPCCSLASVGGARRPRAAVGGSLSRRQCSRPKRYSGWGPKEDHVATVGARQHDSSLHERRIASVGAWLQGCFGPNGGHHIVLIHHDSNDSEMPALVGDIPALVGDIDNDMQALVDSSDSDEEDIQAPPGPAAAARGFANPGP